MSTAILYSFRRCPYAMRARLAIATSQTVTNQTKVELREIVLKDKPEHMLSISPKGTVPVLITADQQIIDESLDIMHWALQQHDPEHWLNLNAVQQAATDELITNNDGPFKHWLDRYKYADRHPEHSEQYYRQQGEQTLQRLEQALTDNGYLVKTSVSLADIALFPFIRQFTHVDKSWFDNAPYPRLQAWLDHFLTSNLFGHIMTQYAPWQPDDKPIYFEPVR